MESDFFDAPGAKSSNYELGLVDEIVRTGIVLKDVFKNVFMLSGIHGGHLDMKKMPIVERKAPNA